MIAGTFLSQILAACDQENRSFESVSASLSALGLKATDVGFDLIESHGVDYIKKLHKDFNLQIASVYNLIDFRHKDSAIMKKIQADIEPQLEACAAVGTPFYMPVPCIAEEHESEAARHECLQISTEYLAELTEAAKAYGITIVVENYSRLRTTLSKISDISHILNQIPDARYVLDTGNYCFGGTDLLEACHTFIDKTVHVHLKDWDEPIHVDLEIEGIKVDGVAVGDGFLPIDKVMDVLKTSGYTGALTVEIGTARDLMKKLEDSLIYIRQHRK